MIPQIELPSIYMTKQRKKKFIDELYAKGDGRSYNEIKADVELALWKQRFNA